ncbi:MAG: GvpL/GvpF family gas vesicle protein [bacterium]
MTGIYLYCIRPYLTAKSYKLKAGLKGIDGAKVFLVSHLGIEAVVSNIDIKKFASKEIERLAKEDVNWIIKHSAEHEKVVEQAMGLINHKSEILNLQSVVPMKFGAIFNDKKNLEQVLKKSYQKFKNILKNLDGKEEWGVKVYVDEKRLRDELKNKNNAIKVKIEGAKELPKGADYFQELETEDMIKKTMWQEIDKQSESFFKKFKQVVCETQENKILAKEITGKNDPMVLNSAYLIRKKSVKDFLKKVKETEDCNPAFIFECTGPWPPYNFI